MNHEFELIHLSTAMCGRHRTDCLDRIGALLDPGNPKPVICVSTQLIEAGVDISFACVVRAMAGLDSIMQAAGRCNRNGESVEPKNVYVYPLKAEDSMERYLPDIAMGKQLTLQIMENYPGKDLLSSNIFNPHRSWRDDSGNPTGTRIVDKAYAAKYRLNSIYGIENFFVVRYSWNIDRQSGYRCLGNKKT